MMLKACPKCGRIHDINKRCYKNEIKPNRKANKFRNSVEWRNKSIEIRKRDNYLCQVCLRGLYNTKDKFNFNTIEVHHITPLEEDMEQRLDNNNLITLCKYHHILAETGKIAREELRKIVEDQECKL